jgi:hypothetical protein
MAQVCRVEYAQGFVLNTLVLPAVLCGLVCATWAINSWEKQKQQTTQVAARDTDVSGFIVKKNDGVIGVWQKRWFVLRGQELRYFKENLHFDSDAAPRPDASHTCVGIDEVNDGGGQYFTLRVTDEVGTARDFPLYTEAPEDRVRWLVALRAAAAVGPLRIQRCTNDSVSFSTGTHIVIIEVHCGLCLPATGSNGSRSTAARTTNFCLR